MTNREIAKLLQHVAAAYTIKNEQKYRFQIIAYQKAADAIMGTTEEIKDLIKEKRLEKLPGIGPSIRSHLEELIKTGKVKRFEWVKSGIPQTVYPLLDVPTLGPKKAFKLVTHFDLKNPKTVIDDIEKIATQGKIANVEDFGEKSQEDILQAIAEFRQGSGKTTRMVLPFAGELAERLLIYLKRSKDAVDVQPLGSLRRMKDTIGDIDFAVATTNPKAVIDYFVAYPQKERIIEKGPNTASILLSNGRQIDLMTQPPDAFGSLLQHFTGSKNHNIHLRNFALSKGMSLSEYGIKKLGKTHKFKTEEELYKFLGMEWIAPELREDTGEIELALRQAQGKHPGLPRLIELKDIKGDLHIHSNYPIEPSHDMGKDTMEEMLKKAKNLGFEYLGFSEHNPSVSKHTSKQIYTILARRKEKIEGLNESKKYIRSVNLLELDILANGNLAIDEKSLGELDACLVSIHSSFNMNKKDMTKRVLDALAHPKAKILCHPTGRMLNERQGYELNFEAVFDFCKKHNKALEINAWPNRLDLPDTLVRQAVKYGVKMVINTDSHALWQMDMMKYGVAVARRGFATKGDIVNTLPYNEFVQWLSS
ncbi:MAG: hypothetical protein HY429_04820 [Candidatus Levybacteria bacterium]|nr:hypothetical protein [Candidatus Levybacteria bacterium]